jgi:flagellar motility protein MotE (MotC chaperone)
MSLPSPTLPSKSARPLLGAIALALAGMVGASNPAATETVPEAMAGQPASEVERFCTGITDVARDRRYSLQAMELKKLQDDVNARIDLLEKKRAEYEDWLKRREAFLDKAQDAVVQIYTAMQPDAAAERLAALEPTLAAGIVMKLEPKKAGIILNEMDSKAAATLTTIMTKAVRREDPS